jgi:UDP-N-acetylglucosamine--N-acetylmuramyl-(pentapeptide) pyrophosphoryl-undecaprenol N-acetylglucosamine transferase
MCSMMTASQKHKKYKALERVIIAGGGTGGHLIPGVAVAQEFRDRAPENRVLFVSTGKPLERRILAQAKFPLTCVKVQGLKGVGVKRQLQSMLTLPSALVDSVKVLRRFAPHLVFGVGSYSSGPVVLAARSIGIPTAVHEQNLIPGVTNRMLGKVVDRVYTSFRKSAAFFPKRKTCFCGNPVRKDFADRSVADEPADSAAEDQNKPFTVLVLGGSQGAHAINAAVVDMLPLIEPKQSIMMIHQTGETDLEWVEQAYKKNKMAATVASFFNDMPRRYRQADLLISRAGATTVAEFTVMGNASVLIPFPHATDDHQMHNALALKEAGAAEVIAETELSGERLAQSVAFFRRYPHKLRQASEKARELARPEAARLIVDDWWTTFVLAG